MNSSIIEKRIYPRKDTNGFLVGHSQGSKVLGNIVNITPFGLMAKIDYPINSGEYNLEFDLAEKYFSVSADVVWLKNKKSNVDSKYYVGMRFKNPTNEFFHKVENSLKVNNVKEIILLTLDSVYSNIALRKIIEKIPEKISMICLSKRFSKKRGSMLTQTIKTIKKSGLSFTSYLTFYLLMHNFFIVIFRWFGNVFYRKNNEIYTIEELARKNNIPIFFSDDINSQKTIEKFKIVKPDLVISAHFDQKLSSRVLDIPKYGCINLHYALLPDFRGPFPTFWAMMENRREAGVSVHFMDKELDQGDVIHQQSVPFDSNDTVFSMDCKLLSLGADLIFNAIKKIELGIIARFSQKAMPPGSYYGYPSCDAVSKFFRKNKKIFSLKHYFQFLLEKKHDYINS